MAAVVVFACGPSSEPLPSEVIGVWRNPGPGYADNYFEIRDDSIVIGLDAYRFKRHAIESVQSKRSRDQTNLEIAYRTDSGEIAPLRLVYTPGRTPHLRIGARPDRWIPEDQADWLEENQP